MEIVISIPEGHYNALQRMKKDGLGFYHQAILNGVPLPKGHGRLVDENEVFDAFTPYANIDALCDALDKLHTVVEADTEGKK